MSTSDWLDFSDVGYCRDCGHEYKLLQKDGLRGHRNMDLGRQPGLVCMFCGSSRLSVRKEKKSPS